MREQHTMSAEEWRPVVGYEGFYEVSSLGHVRRLAPGAGTRPGRVKSLVRLRGGYLGTALTVNDKSKLFQVHRLVATAFVGLPQPGQQVNHKDGNKTNNAPANLEWVTASENMRHAHSLGLYSRPMTNAKLTEAQVLLIRKLSGQHSRHELAVMFGVSVATISGIRLRRTWWHI